MGVSSDLIVELVKAATSTDKPKNESTNYGTMVKYNNAMYVQLDGSDLLTPVSITADAKDGERVTVLIKNHNAIVTGNISSPAARTEDVQNAVKDATDASSQIVEFEILIADKVSTEALEVERGRINTLVSDTLIVKTELDARKAEINKLIADDVTINQTLTAHTASIEELEAKKLDAELAVITYATIEDLESTNADIHNLEATYGEFEVLATNKFTSIESKIQNLEVGNFDAVYANIDFSNIGTAAIQYFLSTSGLIENLVVGEGTVTGELVGVTIKGDQIEGNTIIADKLVIKGTDGLYYKLNTDGMKTEAEQTEHNSLNGSIIMAKSITATKIDVKDLVAFDATIGGFKITEKALYSGAKGSIDNTTDGVYMDSDGQLAIGGVSNYIKYYVDAEGNRKLVIAADNLVLGSTDVGFRLNADQGGRNLLAKTAFGDASEHSTYNTASTLTRTEDGLKITSLSDSYRSGFIFPLVYDGCLENRQTYTLSCMYRSSVDIAASIYVLQRTSPNVGISGSSFVVSETEWQRFEFTFSSDTINDRVAHSILIPYLTGIDAWFEIKDKTLKLEKGVKATDWTPAPEDMASSEAVAEAQTAADSAEARLDVAESMIKQISDTISMLVTDRNGASLMTQTEDGWTFSTGGMQDIVDELSESLNDLTKDVGNVDATVGVLQQAIADLGTLSDHIKIGTYENEPCIELGESDSDFKLLITNTRIMFREGGSTPAYINNRSLYIEKAIIKDELHQGGFVWKVRSNGNLGLMWKGATE